MTGFDVSRRRISVSKNSGNLALRAGGCYQRGATTMAKASITTRRSKSYPIGDCGIAAFYTTYERNSWNILLTRA